MRACLLQNQSLLLRYMILQILDALTTMLFLAHGVAEANPLVRWSIAATHGNLAGLLAVKCAACGFGVMAAYTGRTRAITKMNRFFTVVVGWNLLALALSFSAH